ncbi:PTS sugar transporter subunit IIB, partial [Vibrio anguillarum]
IAIRFWNVKKAIDTIHKASDRQRILLVCRTPKDFRQLVEGGVPISNINVGNMHYVEGKKQIAKTVSVGTEDVAEFEKLKALGVKCTMQGVPTESATDLFTLI